ncbi:MAG: UDP-glucose 4-epimerase GalE [Oligoflexales bacterium]|nr:UDP-glucose 4-epimerase GalE [Oligoflexales bacterium]
MRFFVIGGAGYIGSHFVLESLSQGHECLVYDNLSTGHRESLPKGVDFILGDIHDRELLKKNLRSFKPDAIYHYAAFALVGESVEHPDKYYHNNVTGVATLCDAMKETGTLKPLIFSSSCAVFGNPQKLPIAEDDPKKPISPYGRSKLMAEYIIEDYSKAFGWKAMALRYFNACGAHSSGKIGEDHTPETHLIPNIIKSVLSKKAFTLFGNDFPTKDGTCVRDYIHVTDLAISHIEAAKYLSTAKAETFSALHLGTGTGYSNMDIIAEIESFLGKKIDYTIGKRRDGDADALYADNRKVKKVLGFEPSHSDLRNIISTSMDWHKSHLNGFDGG